MGANDHPEVGEAFVSARLAARQLGVPVTWLRREAVAGRVPSLRIGRRVLLNVQTVERVLLDRAADVEAPA